MFDFLIEPEWILPVEPDVLLRDHVLAVKAGKIAALSPLAEAEHWQAKEHLKLPGHVLLPGFVNAHTHAAMTLFRGFANDLPLQTWLEEHVFPAERRWVDSEFVAAGSRLAVAEMIRGGTTCFNDMYFFPEETARVANQAGIRAVLGLLVLDFPTNWAANPDEYLARGRAVYEEFHGEDLLRFSCAPHAPYTVGDETLKRVRSMAEELDLPIHIHVHETRQEVEDAQKREGMRPLARLDRLGLLSCRLLAVHATDLTEDEICLLAKRGAHVLHCPESNMKLGSGVCEVGQLLEAGVNVALGTDGAASNNDLDMLGEGRSAAFLAKVSAMDSTILPANEVLKIATLGGARALNLDSEIGSLLVGKQADLTAVDLRCPETQPVYDPCAQLFYASDRSQVSHVWVGGRMLLKERQLLSVDLDTILSEAHSWGKRIASESKRVS